MLASLFLAINTRSTLPSFVEIDAASLIEDSVYFLCKLAHSTLANGSTTVALTLPYSEEIYCVLMGLLQRQLLWNGDASFAELLMGFVRSGVREKSAASYLRAFKKGRTILPIWLFGPPPSVSPEERALLPPHFAADAPTSFHREHAMPPVSATAPEGGSSLLEFSSSAVEEEDMNAAKAMESDRCVYGHLQFKRLSSKQRVVSLFLLVLLPYIKRRMAAWHESQMDEAPDAVAARAVYARNHPTLARVQDILAKYVYPYYYVGSEFMNFLFQIFYFLELTPYRSPFHRLFRIAVRRKRSTDQFFTGSKNSRRALMMVGVMFFLFYYGSLALQFSIRHMGRRNTNPGNAPDNETAEMPIPSPPKFAIDTNAPPDAALPNPGECPVCGKDIVNPTVVTSSGIVGCYVCLQEYIHKHSACPVTRQPTSVQQLCRIIGE